MNIVIKISDHSGAYTDDECVDFEDAVRFIRHIESMQKQGLNVTEIKKEIEENGI